MPVIEVRDCGGEKSSPLPKGPGVFSLLTGEMEVSSTSIREKAAREEPLTGLVPQGVERYLEKHGLYRTTGAGL